jgi:hypothetical protein
VAEKDRVPSALGFGNVGEGAFRGNLLACVFDWSSSHGGNPREEGEDENHQQQVVHALSS